MITLINKTDKFKSIFTQVIDFLYDHPETDHITVSKEDHRKLFDGGNLITPKYKVMVDGQPVLCSLLKGSPFQDVVVSVETK